MRPSLPVLAVLLAGSALLPVPTASADPQPLLFGPTPSAGELRAMPAGSVIGSRVTRYRVAGVRTPFRVVQLSYRTAGATGEPEANITSVILPAPNRTPRGLVSLESAYDSMNPEDGPSRAIAGGRRFGQVVVQLESVAALTFLTRGYAVNVPDTEGQKADFLAGPGYGRRTLDAIRVALASPAVALPASTRVGLWGYSGGGVGVEWAAELAPAYAPDVNARLVGGTAGGLVADPGRSVRYVDGSGVWAGVGVMITAGIARTYGVELEPYLNWFGRRVVRRLQRAPIAEPFLGMIGMRWRDLAAPPYRRDPALIPGLGAAFAAVTMGQGAAPTIPLFIAQGTRGDLEFTPNSNPAFGAGDGVALVRETRELLADYCRRGTPVQYREFPAAHVGVIFRWLEPSFTWLEHRFRGEPAPSDCDQAPLSGESGS